MTVTNDSLIALTDAYKAKRGRIKEAQKAELETRTGPEKYRLGHAIDQARKERGLTISEVGAIIGIQNRTFIYDMIKTYRSYDGAPEGIVTDIITPTTPAIDTDADAEAPYTLEFNDDAESVDVSFGDGENYIVLVENGRPIDLPEEWAEHTRERRLLYKQVLADIREHFKS